MESNPGIRFHFVTGVSLTGIAEDATPPDIRQSSTFSMSFQPNISVVRVARSNGKVNVVDFADQAAAQAAIDAMRQLIKLCQPERVDEQTDADAQKWRDTPAQDLSPKMRAFVEKNLRERGETTDLKATKEKIHEFPGGSTTMICGIAGDQVFSMLLTLYDNDASNSKGSGSLYVNGFDNRIAKVCASYGF